MTEDEARIAEYNLQRFRDERTERNRLRKALSMIRENPSVIADDVIEYLKNLRFDCDESKSMKINDALAPIFLGFGTECERNMNLITIDRNPEKAFMLQDES